MAKKIIKILDAGSLETIIKMIQEGKMVTISVGRTSEYTLTFNDNQVFTYDCCRCGNPEHNAITGILEKLNENPPEGKKWTRKEVSSLISFKASK